MGIEKISNRKIKTKTIDVIHRVLEARVRTSTDS